MTLTKLDAMRILGNAFWYVVNNYPAGRGERGAQHILEDKFGYVRRSFSITDLKPQISTEGWNPKGPTHF